MYTKVVCVCVLEQWIQLYLYREREMLNKDKDIWRKGLLPAAFKR